MKPLIHFAHANGVPSRVYQKLFDLLSDEYDVIYVPLLGPDKRYPIDNHWKSLTQQVIDSIVRQANGRKVIGLGHSLGSVLTFQAALQRPELFEQVLMIDPPMIMGKSLLLCTSPNSSNSKSSIKCRLLGCRSVVVIIGTVVNKQQSF
jgi:Predicted hydrolases or acyltransferases (alpha/beta hydrolase superfamily)